MKQVLSDYYEHSLDYTEWMKSAYYQVAGFHKLKDQHGTWLCVGTTVIYIAPDSATKLSMYYPGPPTTQISAPAPTIGISEDALLTALAIAQDPKLAVQLMALRKSL